MVLVGMAASSAMVWQSTQAAFTSTTANTSSSWTAGSVTLSDDDTGAALFTAAGLSPGDHGTNCVTVTYTGTLATAVKVYISTYSDASALTPYLDLTIQEGTGAGFGSCAGFTPTTTIYTGTLAAFIAADTDWTTGAGTWAPIGPAARTYRIAYTLNAATSATKQGTTATATLQWESRA